MQRDVGTSLNKKILIQSRKKAMTLAVLGALSILSTSVMAQSVAIDGTTIGSNMVVSGIYSTDGSTPMNLSILGPITYGYGTLQAPALVIDATTLGTITNSGTIGTIGNYYIAVSNTGTIAAIENGGTLSASHVGIDNGTVGSIGVVDNNGAIITQSSNAIYNFGTIGTLNNSGSIQGYVALANYGYIGTFSNAATGTVGGANGIWNNGGTIALLNNSGSISATHGDLQNYAVITSLTNSGTITTSSSNAIFNGSSGTIGVLSNTGTITSGDVVINNYGRITSLDNSGQIVSSGSTAINNAGAGTIGTLINSGTISGSSGVFSPGRIGTISNSGLIKGTGANALYLGNTTLIENSGTISGASTGIFNVGSIGTLNNSGTVTGLYNAIYSGGASSIGVIKNAGVIAGNITNAAGSLAIGGGTAGAYGTLTGYSGSIGTISNLNGNIDLSGWLLLNDNVNLGAHTLSLNYVSTGSVLALANTVTISGNYSQAPTAVLLSYVADNAVVTGRSTDSGYGRLVVNGTATFSDGATVGLQKVNAYAFAAGQRFVVVQATTLNADASALIYGIAGDSRAVVSGSTMSDGAYTDLVLTVNSVTGSPSTPTSPTTTPATNANAIRALKGLGAYSGVSNAALLNLYNVGQALNSGTATDANKAGEQLSPVAQTQAMQAALAPTTNTLDIVGAHIDGLRLAQSGSQGIATGESAPQYGFWGQAFGGHANQGARDQVSGYSANYGGLLIGLDRAVDDQWRVGGLFSFSNAAITGNGNASGDATHVNSYGVFGYAGFTAPHWYANLSAGVATQHYTESRAIDFTGFSGNANGSFNGAQWVARGEVGYPLAVGAYTLTPLASLTYSYLNTNSYTETGGNGAALNVGASHQTSVKSDLGAKLERAFSTQYGVLVPSIQLAWRHEYDKSKTSVDASFAADPSGATAFSTQGASPVADSATATLGVTLLRASNLSITAQYQLQAASGYVSQAGTLRLRQSF